MTPAINAVKKARIEFEIHEYEHAASAPSFGLEAAQQLGLPTQRVFKTLVLQAEDQSLAVAVVPVNGQLNLKQMAKALAQKKVQMADKFRAERVTGYVLGGISPLGQKKSLATVIDCSAQNFDSIFVSAGRRGLEIELAAHSLAQLTHAKFADIARIG
jgi:Cys-tRNA(Pro)/Cys-tRNA(Cys) deacylase